MKLFLLILLAASVGLAAEAADPIADTAPRLIIVKAIYGDQTDPNATIDVTKQIAAHVKGDAVSMPVGNESFDDPASGVNKSLRVDYAVDGVAGTKMFYENGLL